MNDISKLLKEHLDIKTWLCEYELIEALREKEERLIIGGTVKDEIDFLTNKFNKISVPKFFFLNSVIKPDFSCMRIIDYGNTIQFGNYESSVDCILDYCESFRKYADKVRCK